ncbi:MAG: helix-turn-helix domain-containing protein [Ruminococcaceae bacterium]|nr:helix-turn-helix domain-containing protein [Oscillospiraceae bacterium]
MRNRIKELRSKMKVTQATLAKAIGVAQNTLSYWEQGKYEADNYSLQKIADYFGVSVDYILGRDDITHSNILYEQYGILPIERKKIPMLGEIACGQPIFADEDRESYTEAGTNIKADFCLKAKGDSMINARILDGDIVFIKKQPIVNNGEIAAVIIGDEATLKRVYYYPETEKLILNPENPKYEPLVYVGAELEQIRILGKAIAFQSDVR